MAFGRLDFTKTQINSRSQKFLQLIKTENEMYKNELIRLRALLESGLGGGLRVMMKKREQMS